MQATARRSPLHPNPQSQTPTLPPKRRHLPDAHGLAASTASAPLPKPLPPGRLWFGNLCMQLPLQPAACWINGLGLTRVAGPRHSSGGRSGSGGGLGLKEARWAAHPASGWLQLFMVRVLGAGRRQYGPRMCVCWREGQIRAACHLPARAC